MHYTMDHIVLNALDEKRLVDFYRRILLLAPERLEEFRRGEVPFPSVRVNDGTIIDFFPRKMWGESGVPAEGRPNLNHLCLAMPEEEWEELRERLSDERVALEDGPVRRWGAHGVGISIYFRDPEGNLIEARHYPGRATRSPP